MTISMESKIQKAWSEVEQEWTVPHWKTPYSIFRAGYLLGVLSVKKKEARR